MGNAVMLLGETQFRIGAAVAFGAHDQRGDARHVGLQRQHEHVGHEAEVLAEQRRDARRALPCRWRRWPAGSAGGA